MIVLAVYFIARHFCDKIINNDIAKILHTASQLKTESDLTKYLITLRNPKQE